MIRPFGQEVVNSLRLANDGAADELGIGWADTHIYRNGSNSMGFSANDNVRFLVNTGGARVAVAGTAASPSFKLNSSDTGAYAPATDEVGVACNGVLVMHFAEDGGGNPQMGAFGATPVARQSVTGSRGGNAAVASLATALANLGWITDNTTA